MFLIVGLGNPGQLYVNTRHNIGFNFIDFVASNHKLSLTHKSRFNADIAINLLNQTKIILCKPTSFMNLSGQSVAQIISYHKIALENIIVIHDDIDIPFGKIRCKIGGGSGGHNGLKSIDSHIGSNYLRIRLGVGRPQNDNIDISSYVLSKFLSDELVMIEKKYHIIEKNLYLLFENQLEKFKLHIK